jgi:hypothetical protein
MVGYSCNQLLLVTQLATQESHGPFLTPGLVPGHSQSTWVRLTLEA